MLSAQEIASALGGRRSGSGWVARCPAHEDRSPSLSISEFNGKVLFKCHAGCAQSSVIEALKHQGLWGDRKRETHEPKVEIDLKSRSSDLKSSSREDPPKLVAEYHYHDEQGELLYTVERYEPKTFRQKAANGSRSLNGVRRVPYRLPYVLEAVKAGKTVYICEGEKDVHTALGLGLVATCCAGGANNWKEEFGSYFVGALVVVVPDQDEPGRKYRDSVVASLTGKAHAIKVLNPRVGKDLTDWVQSGATLHDIEASVEDLSQEKPRLDLLPFDEVSGLPAVKWLVKDVLPSSGIGAVYGPSRSGKSFLVLDLLGAISSDREQWFGNRIKKRVPVVYLALEGEHGVPQRIQAYRSQHGSPTKEFRFLFTGLSILNPKDVDSLIQSMAVLGIEEPIICIDTLNQATPGMDENSSEMGDAIQAMKRIQRQTGGIVMIVHHTGKDESKGMRGHSSLLAALDFSLVVTRTEDSRSWKSDKMKDGADDKEFFFGLRTVELGEDEDGDPITSCVIVEKTEAMGLESVVAKDLEDKPITLAQVLKAFKIESPTYLNVGLELNTTAKVVEKTIVTKLHGAGFIEKHGQKKPWKLTEKGENLISTTGADLLAKNASVPVWKRTPERADIDG